MTLSPSQRGITAVCATPSCRKDFGRDRVRIKFVADVIRPPLPAGIGEIGEMRLNTDPMPTPPRIGENGEIQSVKEPMPPPEEFIKSLTYWEVSEMRSDT